MRVLTLAGGDLRLTLRDKSSIFWIFIAPLLWVYFFGFLARGTDPASVRLDLTVIQGDASPLADRFVETLRGQNINPRVVRPGGPSSEGEAAPLRALTIPEGFGEAIARRERVALDLRESSNANPEGTLAVQVALHKGIVRLLAGEALGGLEAADDAVTLRTSWAAAGGAPTGLYQSIPGNLVMFVLLSAMTYGAALLAVERKSGMLRRLASSPLTHTEIIAGKLLGRIWVALMQVGVFLVIGLTLFRIDWGGSPVGLGALLATFIFCAAAIGLLGGTLFASPEASSGVGVTLTLIMSAFGGCWWPSEVMPAWLRTASYAFPSTWAVNGLHQVISWGGGWNDVLPHCAVLAVMGLAAGGLAIRRLKLD